MKVVSKRLKFKGPAGELRPHDALEQGGGVAYFVQIRSNHNRQRRSRRCRSW